MKLNKEPRRNRPRGRDILQAAELPRSDLEFDVMRDVPTRIWDEANQLHEAYLADPDEHAYWAGYLCSLAVASPEFRLKLRQSEKFYAAIKKDFEKSWPRFGAHHSEPVYALADFMIIFPELREFRTHVDKRFQELFQDVRTLFEDDDFSYWDALTKMLILFPEHQKEIFALAQEFKQGIDPLRYGHQFTDIDNVEHVTEGLANARLLFPEEELAILKVARDYWETALLSIKQGNADGNLTMEVCSMFILSKPEAVVTPEGELRLVPPAAQMQQRPELPERLVA